MTPFSLTQTHYEKDLKNKTKRKFLLHPGAGDPVQILLEEQKFVSKSPPDFDQKWWSARDPSLLFVELSLVHLPTAIIDLNDLLEIVISRL